MDAIKQAKKDKFWAYVTVFGTLWGGLELTLGTFLHVLHIPKTGFIMVALASMLIIAQRRIFPARGSTIAAGVIAACIKSLSPGGIIVGPIVGILSVSLIVEFCMLLSSRSVVTAMLASSLALVVSQLQWVFTKWIFYGNDFLETIIKMVEKFLEIKWTTAVGWTLVLILLAIVLVTGCVCGFLGNRLGRRVLRELDEAHVDNSVNESSKLEETNSGVDNAMAVMAQISVGHKNRTIVAEDAVKTRRILAPIAFVTVLIQFLDSLWLPFVKSLFGNMLSDELMVLLVAFVVWFIALCVGARSVIKAIWWPKFWTATVIISVICGVILAWQFDKGFNWALGIDAGVRMFLRGLYVFSLVSWATRCVRSAEILSVWEKLHLPGLGHALTRAYALLPAWLDKMNEMVKTRPKGVMANWKYIRECCYRCIVDAALQTEQMVK